MGNQSQEGDEKSNSEEKNWGTEEIGQDYTENVGKSQKEKGGNFFNSPQFTVTLSLMSANFLGPIPETSWSSDTLVKPLCASL